MSKRTTEAYESVFRYIHEKLIPLRGKSIIIDFEKAMRRALINVLKSIGSLLAILGCWFHFCQALRRKIVQMPELFKKIKSDENYKNIFRQFQCLPLLPLEHIPNTFRDLAKEALKLDAELFSPFVQYFNNEWMKIVTPLHFCVYKRGKRTTAEAEAFNCKLNRLFRPHANFFLFCESLKKLEVATTDQLMNYVEGTKQMDTRHSFYKKRSKWIAQISSIYKDQPKLLLKLLANPKNKALYEDNSISLEEKDIGKGIYELYGNEDGVVYEEVNDESESENEISESGDIGIETQNSMPSSRKSIAGNNLQTFSSANSD